MNCSKLLCIFSLTIAVLACSSPIKADLIYTFEGIANDFPDPLLSPAVGLNEAFVAEFFIDETVLDSDPDTNAGTYLAAITSSSISFAGGHTSVVDFAGGDLDVVQADSSGLGFVSLSDVAGNGTFLFGLGGPLASDAIPDETTPFFNGPISSISLTEPDGLIISLGLAATPTLTITSAIPEPSSAGFIAVAMLASVTRRRRR